MLLIRKVRRIVLLNYFGLFLEFLATVIACYISARRHSLIWRLEDDFRRSSTVHIKLCYISIFSLTYNIYADTLHHGVTLTFDPLTLNVFIVYRLSRDHNL